MLDLFGIRWTENYGPEPSQLWTSAIGMLTTAELKTALRQLLNSGAAHPPTLPELLELARIGKPKQDAKHPESFTPEWNEQRKQLMVGIAKTSRDRGVTALWTPEQIRESDVALALAQLSPGMIGFEEAKRAYEALPIRGLAAARAARPA